MNILYKLPKNAYIILDYIRINGPRTQKQLYAELKITLRALRYALERLDYFDLIAKRANLMDVRSHYYVLTHIGFEIDSVSKVSQEMAEA